ncbi:sodium-dependent glucose transporter 1 [Danio rerio]|uniref:Solute carrier family 60 member 1 n=1 Tax=Danio rerio TaxID=7955 RepID=S60A2_DANRE|nr:sodium-dependent glucose transporter 1 [Danio rerio]A4QN56.1 RecName: Full=Sodium-dependent glucose transporter 1; AltName: Full=Major facilitator superfamily domain-containing protein 4B [Danio rerio]AAI34912.1 Zgc:162161 protein [Danio rerio]|eukprot:NP_001082989.1 sodium-dependent glucose transporter 1 [Danio rerio]
MSPAEAAPRKKHVRFARMEGDVDHDDQEENTLFDKQKDVKEGLKSVLKGGKGILSQGSGQVDVVRPGRSKTGTCWRWLVSLALCASFLGLGMAISVLGPTFEDLAINVNKNISNLSYIFVGRASGYIGGSLLGGILFDFVNPHLLLGFALLTTAFGMSGTPFCKKAWVLTVLMSSVGVSMGVLDTGGNVLILNTWGEQAGPHMQALHFSFAAGAFASPIIAKLLFGHHNSSTNTSLMSGHASKTIDAVLPFSHPKGTSTIDLPWMWAYIVIGAFVLLVSLLFFSLYFCISTNSNRTKTASGKQQFSKHHNTLIILLSMFFFFYVGSEVAYGSFIFTYGKDYVHMEETEAAGLNSLFWGAFAAGRGLAIFFAACLHPGTLILLSLVGTTVSSLLLCLFSQNYPMLWACTALYGISMSTTFPSGISWVEQYTTVTGRSAAIFVVGAALGEMVLPALLGFLLGHVQNYPLLMYLTLCTATFTSILFPVLYKLASPEGNVTLRKSSGKCTIKDADDSEYRQALLENMEEQEENESEADLCNDADFEVIEMDDASLLSSPKSSPPADVAASVPDVHLVASPLSEPNMLSFSTDSPRSKL